MLPEFGLFWSLSVFRLVHMLDSLLATLWVRILMLIKLDTKRIQLFLVLITRIQWYSHSA